MFEAQPQSEIKALLKSDSEFRRLYQRHRKLDKKVADAAVGALPMGSDALAEMKREKLAVKQSLIRHYEEHRLN